MAFTALQTLTAAQLNDLDITTITTSGNGTIGGDLTVTGTLNATLGAITTGTDITLTAGGGGSNVVWTGNTGPFGLEASPGGTLESALYYRTSPLAWSFENASGTDILTIDIDGEKVGVGIDAPDAKFHVHGGTSDTNIRVTSSDAGAYIGFDDSTTTGDWWRQRVGVQGNSLVLQTNGNTRMTVDSSGNVGIGVTPSYKLDVNGNIRTQNGSGANAKMGAWQANAVYAMFGTDDMTGSEYCVLGGGSTDGNTYISAQSGASVYIRPSANSTSNQALFTTSMTTLGNTTAASLVSNGNVNLNGTSLQYQINNVIYVGYQSPVFGTGIYAAANSLRTPPYVYTSSLSNTNNDYYSYSDSSYGGYGGQYHFKADTTASQTSVGTAAVTAGRFYASNTSVGSTSDRRLKKDIQDLDQGVALAILNQLRPRTYEWDKEDFTGLQPHGTQVGFVAQEVDEVFPAWVDWWPEDNLVRESDGEVVSKPLALGFDQQFDAMVVAAIQNLSERIEALETA